MRNFLIAVCLFMPAAIFLQAAEPVVTVPDLPPENQLEPFEETEEVFAYKVLEYYQMAVALHSQIIMLGYEPKTIVYPPTYEELGDLDLIIIKKYHAIARALQSEVLAVPEDSYRQEVLDLRDRLLDERDDKNRALAENFELRMEYQNLPFYRDNWRQIMIENDSLRLSLDKQRQKYYENLAKLGSKYRYLYTSGCEQCVSIVSIAAAGNKFFIGNEADIETQFSFSSFLKFNASPLFNYGRYFDFWISYDSPLILSKGPGEEQWTTNIYSIGLSARLDDLILISSMKVGFSIGAGFYWGESRLLNTGTRDAEWRGETIRGELSFSNFNKYFPMEIYAAYTGFFQSKDLIFNSKTTTLNYGSTTASAISVGLRFTLWRDYYAQPDDIK